MDLQQMMGLPDGSDDKESACKPRDPCSIPGLEEHLEKGMVTFSSIPAWKIPWTEEAGRPQASLVAQMVKNLPAMQEIWFNPQVGKTPWKRDW